VILSYNESDNEIVIIPLDEAHDHPSVHEINHTGERVAIGASGFVKNHDIKLEHTMRYRPEWDDDLGNEAIDGGLRIDLDQDAEVVTFADRSSEEDEDEGEDEQSATDDE